MAEFPLTEKSPVAAAARRTRLLTTLAGLPTRRGARFAKAVSNVVELATAAGIQRSLRFGLDQFRGRQGVAAEIELDTVAAASDGSVSGPPSQPSHGGDLSPSKQGAPQSFERRIEAVQALVDHFEIRSSGTGCVVYLAEDLPVGAVPLTENDVASWAELLEAGTPAKALARSQRQIQRLSAEFSVELADRRKLASDPISAGSATYELLARVVSDTTNTVAVISRDSRVEWVNHAFEELTGYSSDEAVGMPFETFLGTDSDPEWVSRIRRMMAQGNAVSGERIHRRRDGRQYWCTFNISPLHEPDGGLAGWVDIGWDTTSTRKAREALEQARQNAEAANRAKSEFLANMSHEIRTPMNTVLGMTELALGTELTDHQAEYLGVVKNSAQTLLQILNDILDLSKIEAGRLELEEIDFNLADLLRETLRPVELEAEKKGLELVLHLPPDVPRDLRGDPTRLRQILLNLISNAIKFTSQGAVEISVERQWTSSGEVGLQLSVCDTGIGIPADRLRKIFEAFTQADSSTTRQFGGTGLGLTITAVLLRLMNGRIWVESEVGKGSTFHCTLWLREAERPLQPQPIPVTEDLANRDTRSLHILIADDHYPNRQLIAEILQKRGHTSQEAVNGREILNCLENEKFDVVLMDVQMPEMDGFEATAAIRAAERETHNHQPIIAVTAYAMKGDREKCLKAGMDAYLAKPIHSQELFRLVETLAAATPDTEVNPTVGGHLSDKSRRPSEGSGDKPPPIDFGPALERLAGDESLLKRQMSFFLSEAPKLVKRLLDSIEAADASNARLAAHRLKGLVSSYDHHDAAEVAQQLERSASDNRWSEAATLAESLAGHVDQLNTAMRNFIG